MNRLTPIVLVAAVAAGLAWPATSAAADPTAAPDTARTAKERQSGKAYDPQRVNDCKVPPELRGDSTRPTECAGKAGGPPTPSSRGAETQSES